MTYKQAMAYPAKHGGWAHVDDDSPSMQAITAEAFGRKFCIRTEAVYDWAMKHKISLRDSTALFIATPDLLLVCVLNDWTITKALEELAKAEGD